MINFVILFSIVYIILFGARINLEQNPYTCPDTGKRTREKLTVNGLLYAFVWPFMLISVIPIFGFHQMAPILWVINKNNYHDSKLKAGLDKYTEYVLQ